MNGHASKPLLGLVASVLAALPAAVVILEINRWLHIDEKKDIQQMWQAPTVRCLGGVSRHILWLVPFGYCPHRADKAGEAQPMPISIRCRFGLIVYWFTKQFFIWTMKESKKRFKYQIQHIQLNVTSNLLSLLACYLGLLPRSKPIHPPEQLGRYDLKLLEARLKDQASSSRKRWNLHQFGRSMCCNVL